jgi:hypothetical protein
VPRVDEVDCEDAAGLRDQELPPGRPRAAGRGVNPRGMQDLPHRGGRDQVAELDELALHPPVPTGRIVDGHADHELADRGCRGRPAGTPPAGVVPSAGDQPPVPGEQCRRGHHEHLLPSTGPAGTAPRATAGRPAGSGPGRSGGAAPRSGAGAPGARHPWTPGAGPAPSDCRAESARPGRRPKRSLRDDPSPQHWPGPGQARSSNRAPQPQAPRAKAISERITGTLRRELSGRSLIVNEHHLRRALAEYLRHCNTVRPHRALGQLAPAQAHTRPPQINLAEHRIRRKQVLGGLTHEYQTAA